MDEGRWFGRMKGGVSEEGSGGCSQLRAFMKYPPNRSL